MATLDELNGAIGSSGSELGAAVARLRTQGLSVPEALGTTLFSPFAGAFASLTADSIAGLIGVGPALAAMSAESADAMRKLGQGVSLQHELLAAGLDKAIGPAFSLGKITQLAFEKQNPPLNNVLAPILEPRIELPRSLGRFRPYPQLGQPLPIKRPSAPVGRKILPPEVAESVPYFTDLITVLRTLPPPDIITALDYQLSQYDGSRRLYLERLAHYVAKGTGFEPGCWQVVTYWLETAQGAGSAMALNSTIATDAVPASSTLIEQYLADYLVDKCSFTLCDKAAAKVGLDVGRGADTHADLRVHALVAALKETRSLQIASIGIAAFRPVLAKRYGILTYNPKYRPQHGKGSGPNQRIKKWDDAYNSALSFLTNHYEQERRKK